ncbi:MAG TPA: PhoPQ-activated protein PqaA family protein [Planctomycetaceae bacterium]|nr:PhoPQ-activated protein PqaA family protein [Planctomycetaceae bacterium]
MTRQRHELTHHVPATDQRLSKPTAAVAFALALVALWLNLLASGRLYAADTGKTPELPPALANYVNRPEPKFRWELRERKSAGGATIFDLALVSQEWHSIVWEHQLQVYQPEGAHPAATMLLWNQGGTASDRSMAFGMDLARRIKTPVAFLYGIPNQPLLGGKKEDTLIAETFVRHLETKDDTWPLLFPMVKSLVKAMDALQEFSRKEWNQPLLSFVVSGASKRGWTTWLTAAADPRVKGIVPMVIDTLNMREQGPYQVKSFGKYSDQINDYTERGLVPMPDTPEARRLWSMVDPWVYREKIAVPKLLINGNNDPYWTSDALNLYWDDLKGDKWVLYVPNAGHNLEQQSAGAPPSRERAVGGLAAFAHYLIADRPLPKLRWKHDDAGGKARLSVDAQPAPLAGRLWLARAETRDFRLAQFVEQPLAVDAGKVVAQIANPTEEHVAFFAELDYDVDGLKHHFSTQLRILEPAR